MAIKTVGVLGCGLMGAGIAQVSRGSRLQDDRARGRGARSSRRGWPDREVPRRRRREGQGHASRRRTRTLGNLTGTTKLEDLKDCDLVIEAIIENIDEKAKSYAALDAVVAEHAIFCSNTSSLCITELASTTKRPDRFAGLHFFNPVPLMKLVEVIRGADDERRDVPDGLRVRAVARQGADYRARQAGLHRQSAARAVPARRDSLRTSTASARSRTSTRA